jgi:hypothetical protein
VTPIEFCLLHISYVIKSCVQFFCAICAPTAFYRKQYMKFCWVLVDSLLNKPFGLRHNIYRNFQMDTINWLWNNVTSTAESVKKRAISVRDWMWTNKGKSFAIFATVSTLIYLITLIRRHKDLYTFLLTFSESAIPAISML